LVAIPLLLLSLIHQRQFRISGQPIMDANHLPDNDPRRAESLLELGNALRGQSKSREAAEVLLKSAAIYDAAGPDWATRARSIRESVKKD
jgi:hypothetical protein